MFHIQQKRYLHLNRMKIALANDPDLASLPRENLGVILQTLFISTGCNFFSYFKSLGKVTILNTFFQHAEFICGVNMPGCLHHTLEHNKSGGFLSCIRLVGTCYFKKHLAAFVSVYGHETSTHLYNSVDHPFKHNKSMKSGFRKSGRL